MNISKKAMCITLAFIVTVLTVCAQISGGISPAIDVIRGDISLKKCGVVNCDVFFTAKDFDDTFGDKTEYVTVNSLPDSSSGTLKLSGVNVMENQTISRTNLEKLRFVPTENEKCTATFSFSDPLSKDDYVAKCEINVLDEVNLCPETGEQTVETQKNIAAFKFLKAADPENDGITFEVVSYPKNGSITFTDKANGCFEYVPRENYVGKDSFVYTATDVFGNSSERQKVKINVVKPSGTAYFDDMKQHWAHNSAVKMAATGLMTGTEQDGKMCFDPESGISRGDFLAVSLIMSGYEDDIPLVEKTDFADDGSIPQNIKSYAKYAYDKGIISGYKNDAGEVEFNSTGNVTRAEAAVIVDKLLSLPDPKNAPEFTDAASIPDWADSSVAALGECGILNGTGLGELKPESSLTRAQAAEMICNVSQYLEDKEKAQEEQKKPERNIFNLFGLLG